jgi:hypothetical protein
MSNSLNKQISGSNKLPMNLRPMLATPWAKVFSKGIQPGALGPYFVSPKMDGVRCVATRHGLYSRRGHKFHGIGHIEAALLPAFNDDPSLVLDGELYAHDAAHQIGNFERILSAVASARGGKAATKYRGKLGVGDEYAEAEAAARAETLANTSKLRLHVFDIVQMNKDGVSAIAGPGAARRPAAQTKVIPQCTPFYGRNNALMKLFDSGALSGPLVATGAVATKHVGVYNGVGAQALLKGVLAQHYEGIVLRSFDMVYTPDARSKKLIKLVPWGDSEFQVMGIVERAPPTAEQRAKEAADRAAGAPLSDRVGPISALELVTTEGVVFKSKISVAAAVQRRWLAKPHRIVGQFATVRYPGLTGRGVPRYGIVKCIRGGTGWFL